MDHRPKTSELLRSFLQADEDFPKTMRTILDYTGLWSILGIWYHALTPIRVPPRVARGFFAYPLFLSNCFLSRGP